MDLKNRERFAKRLLRALALTAAVGLFSGTVSAETMQMDLTRSIQMALENNRTIKQALTNVDAADAALAQASRSMGPVLSWSTSANRVGGKAYEGSGVKHNYGNTGTISLPVYNAALHAKRSAARYALNAADFALEQTKQSIRLTATTDYFIMYGADSVSGRREVDLMLHLLPYRAEGSTYEEPHPRYTVNSVNFLSNDSNKVHLRPRVLRRSTAIRVGAPFSASDLQRTYNNFARMQAVRYTHIKFRQQPDTTLLDCDITISTNKPSSISFQPEGTNTAGDLGAAASVTYENRNLFRGSELLSVQLRAAYEAITGLEGYQNKDYQEYGVETKLAFPRFLAPFLSRTFRRRSVATSEVSVSWNLQNRPEFHRRVFSTAWRYRWNEPKHHIAYRFDLFDLNYVYMPWISSTFKHDYLDSVSNRNAILRYNYEDLFILRTGFGITFNDGENAVRANIELAGNFLNGVSKLLNMEKNANGRYTFINIAYAQYVKFDVDFTRLFQFDQRNSLAFHVGFGVAYPYGNSTILPFEKRYFAGGANSVRGWRVRELGPGSFKGTDGRIDFINQTGDMKLDLNLEYRTFLGWKLHGAAFIDAGNIWTLRSYAEQPGGQFKFDKFYQQIAVAYGLGLRLNFDYFILRFDVGMKAINPAYETSRDHYPLVHPNLKRDFAFHFAVGLPF